MQQRLGGVAFVRAGGADAHGHAQAGRDAVPGEAGDGGRDARADARRLALVGALEQDRGLVARGGATCPRAGGRRARPCEARGAIAWLARGFPGFRRGSSPRGRAACARRRRPWSSHRAARRSGSAACRRGRPSARTRAAAPSRRGRCNAQRPRPGRCGTRRARRGPSARRHARASAGRIRRARPGPGRAAPWPGDADPGAARHRPVRRGRSRRPAPDRLRRGPRALVPAHPRLRPRPRPDQDSGRGVRLWARERRGERRPGEGAPDCPRRRLFDRAAGRDGTSGRTPARREASATSSSGRGSNRAGTSRRCR